MGAGVLVAVGKGVAVDVDVGSGVAVGSRIVPPAPSGVAVASSSGITVSPLIMSGSPHAAANIAIKIIKTTRGIDKRFMC